MTDYSKELRAQRPAIIGLIGPKRSGKTTVATYMANVFGYQVVGFADPIKKMAQLMLVESPRYLEANKEEIIPWLGVTRRYLLQTLGTEWGRKTINPAVWLLCAQRAWTGRRFIVVPDARFLNEIEFIRAYHPSAQIWRVDRPEEYNPKDASSHHASETELYKIHPDVIIPNTGKLSDLYVKVNQLMEHTYGRVQLS